MSERVLRSPIGCGERGWVGDNNNTHTYRVDTEIERKKTPHIVDTEIERKTHTRILREKIEKDDERKSEEIDLLTVITEVDDGFCF